MELELTLDDAVVIDKLEAVRWRDQTFIRATARDGRTGTATAADPLFSRLRAILIGDVFPLFLRKDARELPALIEAAAAHEAVAALPAAAVWSCIAWVELAVLDLLGKVAEKPVGELLGGIVRVEVPVYLSSTAGTQLPNVEIRQLSERLAATGARAVKLCIGKPNDAVGCQSRAIALLEQARRAWDESIAIYVDMNGACDASNAVEISHVLKSFDVSLLEHPCAPDDFEATRSVTDAIGVRVGWGKRESSLPRWLWAIENRQADVMMPDVVTNGGLMRTADVADTANAAGLPVTPHCIGGGIDMLYALHLVARTRLVGPFQECRFNRVPPSWCTPNVELIDGSVMVPTGPGLGIEIDPGIWREASLIM